MTTSQTHDPEPPQSGGSANGAEKKDGPPPLSQQQSGGPPGMRWGPVGAPLEKTSDFRGVIAELWRRLKGDHIAIAMVVVMGVVSVVMSVVGPKILGMATDILVRGLSAPDGIDFEALHLTLALAAGLYVASAGISYSLSYVLAGIVQRMMFTLRSDIEDKLNRLPLSYVDGHARGDILSRVSIDADNVAQSLQQTMSQLLTSLLTLVGTLAMMVYISPLLALVAVVSIPMSLFTMRFIGSRSASKFFAQWQHTGDLNAQVEEAFTGHAIVKAFGRQKEVEERFRKTNEEMFDASFDAQFVSGTIQPVMSVLGNLNFVAVAVVGGLRIAAGAMTIGDVQAFIQYSRQFSMPLMHVASMVGVFQSGIASAERVFDLLAADEESADVVDESPAPVRGQVALEHVSFSYDPSRPLINDLSLLAEPGRTVAIVGETGAGKTTLVNLIMRFYDVDAGRITIDGRDIRQMSRAQLRSNIGMVLQDTWLFGGTIRENIAYGNLEATEEDILAAARATYVDRFVHSLPDGYDTIVDDEGTRVSAGEKQLITIARAFLADRPILILDEATSSVDTRTEVLVQHAMAALRSDRTSFVIAHRLSTIRDADTILVMDQGRIVDQGSHDELLAHGGAYADLYESQFAAAAVDLDATVS